ncbi:MAG: RagB/SusD family nutrient uptake outer membrane protein [Bacteroidales bacterium]|nr:RagB/SusD family nutrient uptake outer membrane protein [Bacteroidales bacterium]
MRKLIYLTLAAFVGIFTSCDAFLDVKPVGKMIPTEISQFENLLNNTQTVDHFFMMDNNGGCSYAMLGDNLMISENQKNYNYIETFPNLDIVAAAIFHAPMMDPTSTPMHWTYTYRAIGYFNNVIDGVNGIDTESEYAKGVIAQARAGRAWIYMNFVLCYGPMYDPAGANDTPVIPMRTSGDPTVSNGPLKTTAEIFEQVKADLDYACENAPATTTNACRINKACAYALRAEYYMFTRDWENMRKDAQQAWSLALAHRGSVDNMIYDYADFYYEALTEINPPEGCSPEYYMTLRGPDNDFNQTSNRELLLYREMPNAASTSKYYPSEEWLANMDKEKDLRWIKFVYRVEGFSKNIGANTYKDDLVDLDYRGAQLASTQALTYPLLLLIKAEAEARTNKLTDALASLNTLRKYRYDGDVTDLEGGAGMSQDQLLDEILKERRREQPLISFQRTLDLKRYALDGNKPWVRQTITHKVGNKTYSKSITDPYFQSLPIDNAIINHNPEWGLQPNNTPFEPYKAW